MQGCLSFLAIIPDDLADFEPRFNVSKLASIDSALAGYKVDLTVPKFKIPGKTVSILKDLKARGINAVIGPTADLSGMSSSPLTVGDVLNQAYISFDENGT